MSNEPTHVVQSTEIATACVCPFLFKLSYPFGVVGGERDYLIANTVHDIMSLATPTTILDNWQYGVKGFETVAESIIKDSANIIEKSVANAKDVARRDGRDSNILNSFENEVQNRVRGLLIGLAKRVMKKHPQPVRAVTEITITNVKNVQEGRIDAILEYDNNCYGLIDWKSNEVNNVVTGGRKDAWQIIANMFLANYRYTRDEDNWNKCRFGAVVYNDGAYMPRLPISERIIDKVKTDRDFAHQVLCGGTPYAQKPVVCPVCDRDGESAPDCRFYREDTRSANLGVFPDNYDKIRRLLIKRRYLVLKERGETHRHKFVLHTATENLGEVAALEELERAGVIHTGYKIWSIDGRSITLTRENTRTVLEPRKVVRIIGNEQKNHANDIPILACISERGMIKQVNGKHVIIDLPTSVAVERADLHLLDLPITIVPDEINLTRRVLEPMHRFHRLAADFILHDENDGELVGHE
ncbi:MAG: hypothetical protein WA421_11850 [Nitrososphaeraceae archaeon]